MNIALEKTEEHVDGVKKRSFGDAFVRGNNGEALELRKWLYRWLMDSRSHVYRSGLMMRVAIYT